MSINGGQGTQASLRRQPLLEAMGRVAGRNGYRATTVGDVVAEIGASRTTFYKYFDDKHHCFLVAYDLLAERFLATVVEGCKPERPWLERVRGGLATVVELLANDPPLARVLVVEGPAAGAEARRRQIAAVDRLARWLELGRQRAAPKLPAETGSMAAGAVASLLFDEIQAGRAAELPRHFGELLFALLVPYLGPQEAAAEMSSVPIAQQGRDQPLLRASRIAAASPDSAT